MFFLTHWTSQASPEPEEKSDSSLHMNLGHVQRKNTRNLHNQSSLCGRPFQARALALESDLDAS